MLKLYENIKELRLMRGYSQQKLAEMTGYSDKSMIAKIEKGKVDLSHSKVELFAKVLNTTPAHLMGWDTDVDEKIPAVGRAIPVLGTVCAGNGIIAVQDNVPRYMVDIEVDCDFALRVKGDSMKDADIYEGDIVFLKADSPFTNDAIYVIELDGDAFIRYVHKLEDKLLLSPCNPDYEPIISDPDKVKFDGKVVGIYHRV